VLFSARRRRTSDRRTNSLRWPTLVAGSIPFEIQSLIVAALTLISVAISAGVSQGSSVVWGTGHLYEKHGSYYARWRTTDGRLLNRKVGPVRAAGARDGLTRSEAEKEFRHMQAAEEQAPPRNRSAPAPTFGEVSAALRRQLQLRGSRPSYLENCESMDRIHISPVVGTMPVADIEPADIEAVAQPMLSKGLSPKTVRNVLTYVYSVFEYGIERGLVSANPVRHVTRPGRRRQGDVSPDLRFLTVEELEAVIPGIPDEVVIRAPAPTRKGRSGPAPPPPPDVLGPVLRVLILTAAMTGLRQSELLGLRGATSTGPSSASAFATPSSAASTRPTASPISLRDDPCRWLIGSPSSWTGGHVAAATRRTRTSCSPIRRPATRSTARR